MSELIDPDELEGLLKKLPEWDLENNSIVRMMEFDDFMEAIDFVNAVAEIAEEAGHHPDLDVAKKIDTLVD